MNNRQKNIFLIIILIVTAIFFSNLAIWSITLHKNASLLACTRIQFLEYESALKAYCLEYGQMPHFLCSKEPIWLHIEGNSELLIKALSGKNPDGTPLSNEDRAFLNPLCKNFYTFSDKNFLRKKDKSIDRTQLADAFNNPKICIIVEDTMDNDVVISQSCFPKVVQKHVPLDGLQKHIAIFTISPNEQEVIMNWDSR